MVFRRALYFWTGLGFLALAKAKHVLKGYTSPKPIDSSDITGCVDYDIGVVDHWLQHLERYTGKQGFGDGRRVLELGPGADLGIGIYLLGQGCESYSACDVNDLMSNVPSEFYEAMFDELERRGMDSAKLRLELEASQIGNDSALNYVVRDDFDLREAFGDQSIDLVLSQAAFEHFDDVGLTMKGLASVCTPGTVIAAEIDLMTHSRWIRDQDPNNIYRYPQWLYSLFTFRGSPTRLRPLDYVAAFEQAGWVNIDVQALQRVGQEPHHTQGMDGRFDDASSEMEALTLMVCATLPD